VAFSLGTNVPLGAAGDAAVAAVLAVVLVLAALAPSGPASVAPIMPPVSNDPATAAPVMAFCIAFILFTSLLSW
jgi:hypothetical protein